jgi:5-methylcytosine-specific restriction protein A
LVRFARDVLTRSQAALAARASDLVARGGRINLTVNERSFGLQAPGEWPEEWRTLEMTASFSPFDAHDDGGAPNLGEVEPRLRAFFRVVAEVIPPFDDQPFVEDRLTGAPEGALLRIAVNRYERDARNRLACIQAHGCVCAVCAMSFAERYGRVGEDYIHVHHLTPLSQFDGTRTVDPIVDLIPVCANCHAMLHRREPPFTIAELQNQLRS